MPPVTEKTTNTNTSTEEEKEEFDLTDGLQNQDGQGGDFSNMSDRLDGAGAGEMEKIVPPEDTPPKTAELSLEDSLKILGRVSKFLTADELKLKKNSKDGLMDGVVQAVENFEQMKRQIAENADPAQAEDTFIRAVNNITTSADRYIQAKNPFFKKGKQRKALVQSLFNNTEHMAEQAPAYVDAIKVEIGLSSSGNEEKETRARLRKTRLTDDDKADTRNPTTIGYGLIQSGYTEKDAGDLMVNLPDAQKFKTDRQEAPSTKQEIVKTAEAIFALVLQEDIGSYMFNNPMEALKDTEFARKGAFTNMAWECESVRNRYEKYLLEGAEGLAYNEEQMLEISARLSLFGMLSAVYQGLRNIFANPLFRETGPEFLKIFAMTSDELQDIVNEDRENDDPIKKFIPLYNDAQRVIYAMETYGMGAGGSAEQALAMERETARARMKKKGFKV